MASFLERRRARKAGENWLRHARLCRRMREDLAPAADTAALRAAEAELQLAVKSGDVERIGKGCEVIEPCITKLAPPQRWAGFRENLEVLVVAVAVAMAFRTYFLQPFKIPTGSMQPTLYGIHYSAQKERTIFDRPPLQYLKWLVFGEWYEERVATSSGVIRGPLGEQGGVLLFDIGGVRHEIPRNSSMRFRPGDEVVAGQLLCTGNRISGDHLFVNRVRWNFCRPSRGEVMVFKTQGIARLDQNTHYIKRLVGLPGEEISIDEPYLVIDGKRVESPAPIRRIEQREPGYAGYVPAGMGADFLASPAQSVKLTGSQFFGMGDNTRNSFDSRYWGPVPAGNMVGPAWIVYWPMSRRWGRVE